MCRLCGERAIVEGRKPIPKDKYAKQIQLAFCVSVFPPFICRLCEAKIVQWWKKFGIRNKTSTCSISLYDFQTSQSCDHSWRLRVLSWARFRTLPWRLPLKLVTRRWRGCFRKALLHNCCGTSNGRLWRKASRCGGTLQLFVGASPSTPSHPLHIIY